MNLVSSRVKRSTFWEATNSWGRSRERTGRSSTNSTATSKFRPTTRSPFGAATAERSWRWVYQNHLPKEGSLDVVNRFSWNLARVVLNRFEIDCNCQKFIFPLCPPRRGAFLLISRFRLFKLATNGPYLHRNWLLIGIIKNSETIENIHEPKFVKVVLSERTLHLHFRRWNGRWATPSQRNCSTGPKRWWRSGRARRKWKIKLNVGF